MASPVAILDSIISRLVVFTLLLALGWACSGCADPENTRPIPQDSPEGWQNGNAGMISPGH
jgi:hypothetical protein